MVITIALDDVETKLSKRIPENAPPLDISSCEVDYWVEALRFDRRAGALALHLCGFSKPLWQFFFFLAKNQFFLVFKTNFHNGFLETNQKPTWKPASEQQKPKPKPRQKLARNWGRFFSFQKPIFKSQFLNQRANYKISSSSLSRKNRHHLKK